ncbi:MAG: hypothetical protein ACU84Q_11485 [Gammaproteobacteria bacterium]
MPVGKKIGRYEGKFDSIRVVELGDDTRVLEGSYSATVSGGMKGIAKGTMTFDGHADRGTMSANVVGFFASGDVVNGKGQGVYWRGKKGRWEIRGAFALGDQMLVSEGRVIMDGEKVLIQGKIFELT